MASNAPCTGLTPYGWLSVSLGWLAQRLQMGATDSVASLLTRFRARNGRLLAAASGFRT